MKTPASSFLAAATCGVLLAALGGCGGGADSAVATGSGAGASSSASSIIATGSVQLLLSDGSAEDWSTIGVKVVGIALQPQGGGTPVNVLTASTPLPLNVAQLDQLGEILGTATVPVGSYTGAVLTLAANPGDVTLVASEDPEPGFAAAPGATIPSGQIQIQHVQGTQPNQTVATRVTFETPLVVTANQTNALDLEIDLAHPAFIVAHVPPAGQGATVWAVNFDGPVRRRPIGDLRGIVLRHSYGTVSSVAANNTSITIDKLLPTPATSSTATATPAATSRSLQILADAANGTLFHDLDARTSSTIRDFSSVSSGLVGRHVRVAARYQQDGSLTATRIWVSGTFSALWVGPEGHVLHVDAARNLIRVANEAGGGVPLTIDANTRFYVRTPSSGSADATPIGQGPAFLRAGNLERGFKVHASVVDPLAVPLVAQSIDIETANYDGRIANATGSSFTYTRHFATLADDYTHTLPYLAATTANGTDANGNALSGFKYWDFAYPTQVTSGSNAIASFQSVASGAVNFGGVVGSVSAWGVTHAVWGDTAAPNAWSAPWVAVMPTPLPLGSIVTGVVNNRFTMNVAGGTQPGTISFGTTAGAATLAYQVDRTGGVVTVSTVDLSTAAGLTTLTSQLQAGVPVKVHGLPATDGTFKAYMITYYTGSVRSAQ